jgi:hypothetical protein
VRIFPSSTNNWFSTTRTSGQLAHDGEQLVAPAPVDENGAVTVFSAREEQQLVEIKLIARV